MLRVLYEMADEKELVCIADAAGLDGKDGTCEEKKQSTMIGKGRGSSFICLT